MAEYTINLQLGINNDIDTLIRSKQLDAGSRFLNIQLLDDAAPLNLTRHTARFNALTPDGRYIWNDATLLDAVNGVIQVELTNQTLLESGTLVADISIYDYRQRQILTTRTFEVDIQATVRNDDAVMASNEYNAVQVLFQDVRELRDTINETHTNIGDKNSPSGTATVFGWLKRYYDYMTTHSAESAIALVNSLFGTPNPTIAGTDTVFNYLRMFYEKNLLVYIPSSEKKYSADVISFTRDTVGDSKYYVAGACLGVFTPAYDGHVELGLRISANYPDTYTDEANPELIKPSALFVSCKGTKIGPRLDSTGYNTSYAQQKSLFKISDITQGPIYSKYLFSEPNLLRFKDSDILENFFGVAEKEVLGSISNTEDKQVKYKLRVEKNIPVCFICYLDFSNLIETSITIDEFYIGYELGPIVESYL